MRIYVSDLGGRDPHVVDYEGPADRCELESVLYVSVPRRVSRLQLDSRLKDLRSQWRRAAQVIVLRLHSPEAEHLIRDEPAIEALQRRVEGLPILVAHLSADRANELTPIGDFEGIVYDPTQVLEAVRHAELDSWLQKPGVVLPANDDFHYEGPNGCRYESFMRIGTAIQGGDMLDAIAFWLQPYLEGSPVVVLDAWTIISVALNLNRYATQSGPPSEQVVDVDCLGAYDEDPEKLRLRLAAISDRSPGEPPPVLLISSVVSMGNLHNGLKDVITGAGFAEPSSVALYGDANAPETVFCRPDDAGRYWRPDEECPLGSDTVPIAPSTYLVEVSTKPKLQRILGEDAALASEFFGRYRDGDFEDGHFLSVHRDEPHGEGHNLIHIDVQRLVCHREFGKRLEVKLRDLTEIDVILSPRQPAAVALARKAEAGLGANLIVADESELSNLHEDEKKQLREASQILLVDDVVISGTRLLGYRNFLRRGDFVSAEHPAEIHLLTGVTRVDDNTRLRGITDMVHGVEQFHTVEELLLPDWGVSDCPWCWELRQFEAFGNDPALTDEARKRWNALRDKRRGLQDSLFIPWVTAAKDPLPVSAWDLGPGSIFEAETQVELFATVASTVQSLRSAGRLFEQHRYPLAPQALDPACWLSGRYYDSVIVAAILRATRRHDLRTALIDPKLLKEAKGRAKLPDLRGELVMAAARGHLPIGPDLALDGKLLNDPKADDGFVALMRRAIQGPRYSNAA
jgi:hypothetical protein